MKKKERFARIVAALALTAVIGSQVPVTGGAALAQTGGCSPYVTTSLKLGKGSNFKSANTAGAITAIGFGAALVYAFLAGRKSNDNGYAAVPASPDLGVRAVVRN